MTHRPLTERDIETLRALEFACRNHRELGYRHGWAKPMDCGAWNGSHHSYTLTKLARRGYAERKNYARTGERGSCLYRMTDRGQRFLERLLEERATRRGSSRATR